MQRKRIRDAIARVDHHSNSAVSKRIRFSYRIHLIWIINGRPVYIVHRERIKLPWDSFIMVLPVYPAVFYLTFPYKGRSCNEIVCYWTKINLNYNKEKTEGNLFLIVKIQLLFTTTCSCTWIIQQYLRNYAATIEKHFKEMLVGATNDTLKLLNRLLGQQSILLSF